MKCSEEDDLRQYLDKAQDLFACLNDMGATITNSEFLDIILAALLPSYESVMNALTTPLEEVGKPIEIDSVILLFSLTFNVTHQYKARLGCGNNKQCHVTFICINLMLNLIYSSS